MVCSWNVHDYPVSVCIPPLLNGSKLGKSLIVDDNFRTKFALIV